MSNYIARRRKSDKGFTLIELLVVIVILGILAAVVVFAIGGITDKGNTSACKVDTRTLRTAEEANFAKFDTYADQATLVTNKFLSEPSTLHDVQKAGGGGAPTTDFEIAVTATGVTKKCAPAGTTAGTKVNGTTIF
jgi:general secretion pathway protein G